MPRKHPTRKRRSRSSRARRRPKELRELQKMGGREERRSLVGRSRADVERREAEGEFRTDIETGPTSEQLSPAAGPSMREDEKVLKNLP